MQTNGWKIPFVRSMKRLNIWMFVNKSGCFRIYRRI